MADQWVWTSPDGATLNLSDISAGYIVTADGQRGLRSPTYSITSEQYAGQDGATVQAVRAEPRTPSLGLHMSASSREEFRARMRGLVRLMRPKAGVGRLTVTTEWGESRSIDCYCTGGLEGDEAHSVTSPGLWFRAVLQFFAPDPWWLGEKQMLSLGLGAPSVFFPIFPLNLSPSAVQGSFTVDLADADAPSYPVWTVVGPGTALTLANLTTGRSLTVNAALAAGDSIVVDTRPNKKSVRRGDGTNLMASVAGDPQLWPLIEGRNDLSVILSGATSASRIIGEYQPRYAGI